ncbi:methylated-DNA--[protein]-cysteine S-methyltransferase [Demequina sp. SYSU T00039]|uniref:Methylated-DNA--protein-cysteine methyltransferase n=1 Tax=Demequina lignilytica TaxID=3051663 RepID=A0AAW7M2R2_9MICO|nr:MULTISPECIES: methylated-DNA--[protein]-cysteine S-methyltransferase [unclassified Demequina]MDN4478846.1 methylated-DNA--[protein]-cysteine S-methyltransferase [Demequina sp. SYSU T00039-1]MDN4488944.1 methylated-DNA--[protein]-cysteine S-methyltransferase [Demequina sp. SYSU T00039]MDN4490362.1 methylated-DNA--[protein]-cysteine S-methyltransferase [Demequina sp. SYSU T00068]
MTTQVARDIPTPMGPLTLVASEEALVGAYFDDHRRRPELDGLDRPPVHAVLDAAEAAYAAYLEDPTAVPPVATLAAGTDFERSVWAALSAIPCGETRTYAQVADAIGRPTAVRAVAGAIGRNRLTVLVPCHRVVGADGSLTGYAGGVERKRWLLEHERPFQD